MKIHEFQAKQILKQFGVAVPRGEVAKTVKGVFKMAQKLGCEVVVKAQIHAGGRGKAGGVKLAKTPEEAQAVAQQILRKKLVTAQTGPEGQRVRRVLVEETLPIERELYLGIVVDRANACAVFMASSAGGVEIEKVAE
ncbi:MAG: acetate--CoA ligase family protein, partial [Acidobacteria bacterium]|nr:acetate--CoA ligase family protein [Acidobacteriota bacterium]